MSKLDDIANKIGSPYGEGATFSEDNDTSHLDDVDYKKFKDEVKALFLELVGEDDKGFADEQKIGNVEQSRNQFRAELRDKINTL